jgi:transcription elongation factor Elf1
MPVVIACSACQGKMSIPETLSGKVVKCPTCGQTVQASGGSASAPVHVKVTPTPPRPAAAPAPAAGPPIVVACTSCQKKLQVKATLAGKAVKCPGCGNAVKIPAPSTPADQGEEWLDVNEAAAPPPEGTKERGRAGDWGQEILEGQGVPRDMQEEIHSEMTKTERVVWAGRPRVDILLHRARLMALIAVPVCSLVAVAGVVAAVLGIIHGAYLALIGLVFSAAFGFGAVYTYLTPGKIKKNADRRSCYALTNRRLLIHKGEVAHVYVGRHGAQTASDLGHTGKVTPYTGLELTRILRVEAGSRFPGAGDIWMGRTIMEEYSGWGLQALDAVGEVEKRLREKLIHPVIDKLLRGEPLTKEEKGRERAKEKGSAEEGNVLSADSNIKEYGGAKNRKPEIDPDDPNIKNAPNAAQSLKGYFEACLKAVPAEVRQSVEAELTPGEKILWIGRPEAGVKGRGFFGAVMGSAKRYEPDYTHYAITNRRVLLFARKQAPLSYYTPTLVEAGVEGDDRIANGGGIVFRKVKKIVTETDKNNRTTTTVTLHYFGLLRIRNYKAVAALMYDTLIGPVKGL